MSIVAMILATLYPFMKRYTHLPQLVLGMAFGWAVSHGLHGADGNNLPLLPGCFILRCCHMGARSTILSMPWWIGKMTSELV